jgi:hypothetical protein
MKYKFLSINFSLKESFVKLAIFVILFGCLTLAGCYHLAPGEGELSTVPVTNNPNAMPGPMKTSPMPSVF